MSLAQRHSRLTAVVGRAAASWVFHQCSHSQWKEIMDSSTEQLQQRLSSSMAEEQHPALQAESRQAERHEAMVQALLVEQREDMEITYISADCRHRVKMPTWVCKCCGQVSCV
jgi:rubrerythrin